MQRQSDRWTPAVLVLGNGTNLSRLLKVDKATGAAINTLDLTGALLGYSAGIAFDPQTGTAYIADGNFRGSNTLYTLNTSTGVLSAVGPTGTAFRFGISGLAFSPVPEPGTVWFLLTGSTAMLWMRIRRKH
jgi:DNA-binding beta-propeller fold protein YncE